MRVAVDIGGTFTDVVAIDDAGRIHTTKALTTPADHIVGVRDGLAKLALDLAAIDTLLHGSTIAINAVIERKGARTGLVTTEGFRDVYEIGRGNRPDAYNIHFRRPEPLVPRERRVEVRERISARGEVLTPLDDASVEAAIDALEREDVESVAVCLLHSYAEPEHERRVGLALARRHPEWHISLSHRILREIREYERTSTTVLNAYIAPIVSRYLGELERVLRSAGSSGRVLIMQSNGGTMSVATARVVPAMMMESGPVAGVIGAAAVGAALGRPNVISFDMGGTTAKSSLVQGGELELTAAYYIGGYATGQPLMLPVVDIVEVGAGGGSIAWIDAAGALKVGPRSAGASPGPACFGRGGTEPTVTDADLVLGRIDPEDYLGGELRVDRDLAVRAIANVAAPLGLTVERAAAGIVEIADAAMSLSVRSVSVARGRDPRDFALVTSGGGGPLHGVAVARDLGIPVVVVPLRSSIFSAEGLLSAPLRHDLVRTALGPFARIDAAAIDARLDEMQGEADATLATEGAPVGSRHFTRLLDLRYVGQDHSLSVPLEARLSESALPDVRARFDELHRARYGHHAPRDPVELVDLRLRAEAALEPPGAARPSSARTEGNATITRPVILDHWRGPIACAVHRRKALAPGARVVGPAVVQEYGTATLLYEGDEATVSTQGHIVIRLAGVEER